MTNFYNPVEIVWSSNYEQVIKDLLIRENKKKVVLITSERFKKSAQASSLLSIFNEYIYCTDIETNPSVESCQRALDCVKNTASDVVIAIGGGSVLDTAKAVRLALYTQCFFMENLLNTAVLDYKEKPLFIAVPTTHGTGSEVTMWATIWDKKKKMKYSLSDSKNYPDYALYDTSLTTTLSIENSIISVLDALSHAFETLWNKNENSQSDEYAYKAIKVIFENLKNLDNYPSFEMRKNFLQAASWAGLAFSNTKTAAAHSISYPLTIEYNIPHGIACSLPLKPLLKINKEAIKHKLEILWERLAVSGEEQFWKEIEPVIKGRIPFQLREFSIKKDELSGLVKKSFTKGRMDNNMVDLTEEDVLHILQEIY